MTLVLCQHTYAQSTDILVQDSDYELGLEAFSDGEYERAANLWLAEAYNGSVEAQFNVGVLYIQGKGVTRNRVEAAFWFEKAAEQEHPEAQYNLGHLMLEDQDDITLIAEGINWWRKSAEKDFAIAQYNYGRAIFYGIGVEQDRKLAKEWIEKAALTGNQRAEQFLSENANAFTNETIPRSVMEDVYLLETEPPSEELINRSEYLLVSDQPILMYSRFNTFAPVVTRIKARVLLRVAERARNWIRVEIPGGVPGWVETDRLKIEKDFVEVTQDKTKARTEPAVSETNSDIGELIAGTRLVLLEQQDKWTRVLLPENMPGWIEDKGVKKVSADAAEISRVWQAQRIRLKVSSLSSREIKISVDEVSDAEVNSAVGKSTPGLSGEEQLQIGLSDLPSEGLALAAGGTGDSGLSLNQGSQSDKNGVLKPDLGRIESGVVGTGRYERSSIVQVEERSDRPSAEPPKADPSAETAPVSAVTETKVADLQTSEDPNIVNDTPESIRMTLRGGVEVRVEASTNTPTFATLPANTLVDLVGLKGSFAEVLIPGGLPVWIRQSEGKIQSGENVLIEGSRVRALSLTPEDGNAKVLGLLAAGTVVRLIEQNDNALRVVAPESISGWVSVEDLKETENVASFNKVWREQSKSLLTSYLDVELQELALVPTLGDNQLVGTGITNDNNWLFEETSKGFTLQLFSIQNQSSALSQFRSLNGRGQLFSTKVKGRTWHFVLLGKFLTRESAELAARQLPSWTRDWRVRSVKRLQVSRCKKLTALNEQETLDLEEYCS